MATRLALLTPTDCPIRSVASSLEVEWQPRSKNHCSCWESFK